jgi:MFS family permease
MTDRRTVRVRRSPRVGVFLAIGALLGLLIALVATLVTPAEPQYPTGQVLGYVALITIPVGAALGGLVAVVLDARATRRARTAVAERATTERGRAEQGRQE